jgi:hypothetical protein
VIDHGDSTAFAQDRVGVVRDAEEGAELLALVLPVVAARLAVELVRRDVVVAIGGDRRRVEIDQIH